MRLPTHLWPTALCGSLSLLGTGLYSALFASPPDYQQGEAVRMMYVHVPCAWLALGIYGMMALSSALYLIARWPIAELFSLAIAPIGACFAALTLVTGALWGKPIWGTWWVWDARLTSMLILFCQYLGYLLLARAKEGKHHQAQILAVLAVIGAINLPIIKFSVEFWHSLHQPASIIRLGAPTLDKSMLLPLFLMALACTSYSLTIALLRVKTELLRRKLRRRQFQMGQFQINYSNRT